MLLRHALVPTLLVLLAAQSECCAGHNPLFTLVEDVMRGKNRRKGGGAVGDRVLSREVVTPRPALPTPQEWQSWWGGCSWTIIPSGERCRHLRLPPPPAGTAFLPHRLRLPGRFCAQL